MISLKIIQLLMIQYNTLDERNSRNPFPERLGWKNILIRLIAFVIPRSLMARKLMLYNHILGFIRFIGLYIYHNNNLGKKVENKKEQGDLIFSNSRIQQSYFELMQGLELTGKGEDSYRLKGKYMKWLEMNGDSLTRILTDRYHTDIWDSPWKDPFLKNTYFIRNLTDLYRTRDAEESGLRDKEEWLKIINQGELDYEIRLCETLMELTKLDTQGKIKSAFEESYYTRSGTKAFDQFTGPRFREVIKYLYKDNRLLFGLDIGCGTGNYLDVLNDSFPDSKPIGLELQEEMSRATGLRFIKEKNITIENQDFFSFISNEKFDLVMMNYVLFYFPMEKKKELFTRIKEILSENGRIVICQYYSSIEPLKKELAIKQGDYNISKSIEMYYSNKVLYANTLWNDAVDTFQASERWDEFTALLDSLSLEVEYVTNADKYYYSLFVVVRATVNPASGGKGAARKRSEQGRP